MSEWFPINSGVRQGYKCAPNLFLLPTDRIMERTVHRGLLGETLGSEFFTDLDFADDAALLAEMLEITVLALEILDEEARQLGLEVNWNKTKIQSTIPSQLVSAQVAGNKVVIVKEFIYLDSLTDKNSETEALGQIGIARGSFTSLKRNIWRSCIHIRTKLHLYAVYLIPVLLYGA